MNEPSSAGEREDDIPPPRGTVFVMAAYMIVLALMWAGMYYGLLTR
jgi:hypothetical protein